MPAAENKDCMAVSAACSLFYGDFRHSNDFYQDGLVSREGNEEE
ncbi:hypothetical protein [Oxalicibacterium flavum]|nr:hypothetical protein [Oxalicibacterium flavum]